MIRILLIFLVITYISFSNNTKKQDEEYIPINGIKKRYKYTSLHTKK